jgi:tight adherence protein B
MNLLQAAAAVCAALAVWCWIPARPTRGPFREPRSRSARVAQSLSSWRRRRVRTSEARTVGALTAALASELRSGQTPDGAVHAVLSGWSGSLPGRYVPSADVVTLLNRWSHVPGWGGMAAVAICWRVADSTGAGLADALDRIGEAMRHEHEVATEVDGQLASVRATAAVLATLPAVAVAMGHVLGAKPIEVLLGTAVGAACLAAGAALAVAGWWWLTHQVESVRKTLRW